MRPSNRSTCYTMWDILHACIGHPDLCDPTTPCIALKLITFIHERQLFRYRFQKEGLNLHF